MLDEVEQARGRTDRHRPDRVPSQPAFAGHRALQQGPGDVANRVAAEGARTVPPREHAVATATSRICRAARASYLSRSMWMAAAWAWATCTSARATARSPSAELSRWPAGLHARQPHQGRRGQVRHQNPIFKPSPIAPTRSTSKATSTKQHYLDVTVAYRQACLNAIEHLKKFGYSGAQALLHPRHRAGAEGPHQRCGGRHSNACATLWLPTDPTSTSTHRRRPGEVHRRQRADADHARQEVSPRSPAAHL